MTINCYLRYHTRYGQALFISGNIAQLGSDKTELALPMQYFNDEFWHVSFEIEDPKEEDEIRYRYILKDEKGHQEIEQLDDRFLEPPTLKAKDVSLYDTWNYSGDVANAFFTQPFREVLLSKNNLPLKPKKKKAKEEFFTHEFRVKFPLTAPNEVIFLSGNAKVLGSWDESDVVLLTLKANWWTCRVDLHKASSPLSYKYGIYNTEKKEAVKYEDGNNRMLQVDASKKKISIIHDGFVNLPVNSWKGAGIAVPVFSLRSRKSFGIGEFTDLRLLVDWAKNLGIKMIQVLPVNDTTATHTNADSYPYAAISAFAFHPGYINLEQIAGIKHAEVIKPLRKKQRQLNELPEMDYEQVMKFKNAAVRELFQFMKDEFKNNTDYFEFFELNRHWLVPYAAFCYLRDKNGTADFSKWRSHKVFDEDAIQLLASVTQKHYDEIAIHYFIQYHLHLQLRDATDYAHRNGVILKGDIPIGIYRHSVDAWMNPSLYNMHEQAGAPPDDFAVKGQNWGFPTYNWKKMQEDGYLWWRQRFEQMSVYFDAFRIDHILGFFRIWSIPVHAVEGILGRFVPALALHMNEFMPRGIWFDYFRYCRPYITDDVLAEFFGEKAGIIKVDFLVKNDHNTYDLREGLNTQASLIEHFKNNHDADSSLLDPLINLVSNVILIEEEGSQMQQFHFRFGMEQTNSFRNLDPQTQNQLRELYVDYFFRRQDKFWEDEGMKKLPDLKRSTNMLICGEDLGLVPACVPGVMKNLGILSLEIQRMPKDPKREFSHPNDAPYLSVVTPSTHDMSTIRGWWEEDRQRTQKFYNHEMGHHGDAPYYCEPWINKEIVMQHLYSPAMWSVFQIQDILGSSTELRKEDPKEERINVPADPKHYWRYRMHLMLEDLIKESVFNNDFRESLLASGRAAV